MANHVVFKTLHVHVYQITFKNEMNIRSSAPRLSQKNKQTRGYWVRIKKTDLFVVITINFLFLH